MAIKVLVIDDEPPIRKLLRMGLGSQGYEVIEASNGKLALQAMANTPPDLVVLDLGLPDLPGHELLRQIRARSEAVPIVVLSSRGDEAGKVEALDLDALGPGVGQKRLDGLVEPLRLLEHNVHQLRLVPRQRQFLLQHLHGTRHGCQRIANLVRDAVADE